MVTGVLLKLTRQYKKYMLDTPIGKSKTAKKILFAITDLLSSKLVYSRSEEIRHIGTLFVMTNVLYGTELSKVSEEHNDSNT